MGGAAGPVSFHQVKNLFNPSLSVFTSLFTDCFNIKTPIGGWPWLNCFGHNFYLAVTKPMASVKERTARAMGLYHTIVGEFAQVQILRHMLIMVNYKCYDLIV